METRKRSELGVAVWKLTRKLLRAVLLFGLATLLGHTLSFVKDVFVRSQHPLLESFEPILPLKRIHDLHLQHHFLESPRKALLWDI